MAMLKQFREKMHEVQSLPFKLGRVSVEKIPCRSVWEGSYIRVTMPRPFSLYQIRMTGIQSMIRDEYDVC